MNKERLPELKENIEDYTTEELIIMGKRYAKHRISRKNNRDRFYGNHPHYSRDYHRTHKQKDLVKTINQQE